MLGKKILISFILIFIFFTNCSKHTEVIKVVQISFIQPEQNHWIEDKNLKKISFNQGIASLYLNQKNKTLHLLAGLGTANVVASLMALGNDPRFDLTHAYFILTGIAGGDPMDISLGSVALGRYIVDADLRYSFDARDIPKDWDFGIIPFSKSAPYSKPVRHSIGIESFQLNETLLQWAFHLVRNIPLTESSGLIKKRALYSSQFPYAAKKPFIMIGDNLSGQDFWHGSRKNQWANKWVKYHTEDKGNFVTSAMEDSGVMLALYRLNQDHKVDINRVLELRSISNFTVEPQGKTPQENLLSEMKGYSAFETSLDNLYTVSSKIVEELISHWDIYKNTLPKK